MFNNWQFWLAVAVSLLFLLLLLYQVDLGHVRSALLEANYLYVAPAVAVYFVSVYFRSVRWKFLLSPIIDCPVRRLYPVVVMGYMANNLLPARLGELVRSYYLARRESITTSTALATVAVERVYDGLTLLVLIAVAAPVLLALGQFDGSSEAARTTWIVLAALMAGLFLFCLAVLTALVVAPRSVDLVLWCLKIIPSAKARTKIGDWVVSFVSGLQILRSPKQHLALFLLSLPVWLMEGAVYYLVAYSFDIDQLFGSIWILVLVIALVTATSNLATALPTAIGGIGPFEVVAQQTLLAVGVDPSTGAAYSGFVHLVALWLPVNLVGLVLAWKQNMSLTQIAAAGHDPEAASSSLTSMPRAKEDLP